MNGNSYDPWLHHRRQTGWSTGLCYPHKWNGMFLYKALLSYLRQCKIGRPCVKTLSVLAYVLVPLRAEPTLMGQPT